MNIVYADGPAPINTSYIGFHTDAPFFLTHWTLEDAAVISKVVIFEYMLHIKLNHYT